MSQCPDLGAFEAGPLSLELASHVERCPSCQFVVELLTDRSRGDTGDCSRFEALLAARAGGSLGRAGDRLLARHLAGCEACRAVADTLAPTADAAGDLLALPEVDPGSYELGLEVARGGMGRILAARDRRIGRPVAVKELIGHTPALAARFEREARLTARLQHPGILPIYEIGQWPGGTPFYAMRMVDGRTLRAAIETAPALSQRLALLPAMIAATDAVAFAHAQRIIHRDLTPANILLGAYGETVVIDWGLAKDLSLAGDDEPGDSDSGASSRLTGLGAVLGTAGYMPPEQAHALSVDERADVYALGSILYHLLAGEPPYRERGADRLLAAVRTGPPPPIQERAPGAPRELVSIVGKAMAREPDERYPSARELSEELRRFAGGRLVAAHVYTRRERLRRFLSRHRAVTAVVMVAALVLGTSAWVSVQRILDSQEHSDRTARTLLVERGRTELLAGQALKALAYLGAADDGGSSPALDFLLASALREVDDLEATLDCGGDVQVTALSPDGQYLAAACTDTGRVWRLDDHRLVHSLGPSPAGYTWVAYSGDGRILAFIGEDGAARVHDAASGELRHHLVHAAGTSLNRVALNRDGSRMVTTGSDGKAVVWDALTGTRLRTIRAGALGFVGVYGQLAPDDRTLLTVTMGGVGTGWDIETGEELGSLSHGAQVRGGDLSRDGALAVTCGADRRVVVWDLRTRAARLTLTGHADEVWRCAFDPSTTRLVSAGADGTAKVWDLADGSLVTSVDAGDFVYWAAFSPDARLVATATLEGRAQVWDATTGAPLSGHVFGGAMVRFTPDGARLIMHRSDGKLQLWRRPAGRQRTSLAPPPGSDLRAVDVTGARAVIGRGDELTVWDVGSRRPLTHPAIGEPFALAGDGRRLVARSPEGLRVLELATGAPITLLPAGGARELMLDDAGGRLLIVDGEGPPRVVDVASGRVLATLAGATDGFLAGDGRRALAWRDGEPPTVWSVDQARPLASLGAALTRVRPVGFSADGRRVAVHADVDRARTLLLWDADDGAALGALPVMDEASRFDPGGTLIATVGPDGMVRVVRAADGALVASFAGERVSSAQCDRQGELLAVTDRRGAVSVVDARDGRVLARWPLRTVPFITTEKDFRLTPSEAWWTPDGAAIVTHGLDATVWDAERLAPGSAARVDRAVRALPWRVEEGRLVPVRAAVRGRVTRGGAPVAGARLTVTFREVPAWSMRVHWAFTQTPARQATAVTGLDGTYLLGNLPSGGFTLVAHSADGACRSLPLTRTLAELDQAIDLELTECGPALPAP